jgi:hypothetical protein
MVFPRHGWEAIRSLTWRCTIGGAFISDLLEADANLAVADGAPASERPNKCPA